MADDRTMVAYRPGVEMLKRLQEAADSNHRSVAAEVAFRVEQSFGSDQRTLIREEVRAAFMDHEAELAVARVRRSAALEELARNDADVKQPLSSAMLHAMTAVPYRWRI